MSGSAYLTLVKAFGLYHGLVALPLMQLFAAVAIYYVTAGARAIWLIISLVSFAGGVVYLSGAYSVSQSAPPGTG